MKPLKFPSLLLAGVLAVSACGFAQSGSTPPPGGDMVGSDRAVTPRAGTHGQLSPSPNQNQQMTNTGGTTTGFERAPAKAGASIHETQQAQQNVGTKGVQGEMSATAGRRRAHHQKYSVEDTGAEKATSQSQSGKTKRPSKSDQQKHPKKGGQPHS